MHSSLTNLWLRRSSFLCDKSTITNLIFFFCLFSKRGMHPFTPYHKAVLSWAVHLFPVPCPFSSWLPQQQHGLQVTVLIDLRHPGPNLPPHTDPVLGWHGNPWAERRKILIIQTNTLIQWKYGTGNSGQTSPCHPRWDPLHLHPLPLLQAVAPLREDPLIHPRRVADLAQGLMSSLPSWRLGLGWWLCGMTLMNPANNANWKTKLYNIMCTWLEVLVTFKYLRIHLTIVTLHLQVLVPGFFSFTCKCVCFPTL